MNNMMQLTIQRLQQNKFLQCAVAAFMGLLFISWMHMRPLGVTFLTLFCFWLYKTRCNFCVVPPSELTRIYENLLRQLIERKQNNPILFVCAISVALGSLATVGHFVSGSTFVIIGLAVLAIISSKYNFKIVKIKSNAFSYNKSFNSYEYDDDCAVDEFMPDVNESNLFVLQNASDLTSIATATNEVENDADNDDNKSDDIPSELLLADNLPEIERDDTSDEEHNDLLPIVEPAGDNCISKTTRKDKNIGFVDFKADISLSDTSSSSEENLSKGLRFPEVATRDTTQSTTDNYSHSLSKENTSNLPHTLLTNTNKFLPKFMSGLLKATLGVQDSSTSPSYNRRVVTALDSSDESDFEILQSDDFK